MRALPWLDQITGCGPMKRVAQLVSLTAALCSTWAQTPAPSVDAPDYSNAVKVFPRFYQPYESRRVPEPRLVDGAHLEIEDGKLHLSMARKGDRSGGCE